MIAALFVAKSGPYWNVPGIDPWDELRDARNYDGPNQVIAHPPCERWGRYWSGGPSAKVRRKLGDDNGCFKSALIKVAAWGGVLEHPADTHAWNKFELEKPNKSGGWLQFKKHGWIHGWTCHVEQGHYGHLARKATWLLYVGTNKPRELIWGPSSERKPMEKLSKIQRMHTPIPFRDLLISLVRDEAAK